MTDRVASEWLATSGDGTCSEGEFWEAVNNAVNLKLPVLFLIQDNGYAISTPTAVQYAGANVAALLRGWEPHGLLVIDDVDILDGTPLLDIKPYVPAFDCFPDARAGWFGDCGDRVSGARSDCRFH